MWVQVSAETSNGVFFHPNRLTCTGIQWGTVFLSVRVLAGGQCCSGMYCATWCSCACVMDHALALSYFADTNQCSWGVGVGCAGCV